MKCIEDEATSTSVPIKESNLLSFIAEINDDSVMIKKLELPAKIAEYIKNNKRNLVKCSSWDSLHKGIVDWSKLMVNLSKNMKITFGFRMGDLTTRRRKFLIRNWYNVHIVINVYVYIINNLNLSI